MQQLILANWDKLFQSTFPRGERQMTKGKKMDPSVISIHVPSWGTTTAPSNGMPWLIFQSTFPRGERPKPTKSSPIIISFQSTFPRGERREAYLQQEDIQKYFNPRSLVGNDAMQSHGAAPLGISIHVPSWGTTILPITSSRSWLFQSTFPRGERHGCQQHLLLPFRFQSTFPRGERLSPGAGRSCSAYFNPRSLVGNDGKFSQIFFVFLCNKYNFSTFYYPFSLFFSVIHVTFLIFVVRILPAFYVYF